MKFYLDFAHRLFHHDELHFMINIADVHNPHALVVCGTSAQIGIYRRATSRYVCAKVGVLVDKTGE